MKKIKTRQELFDESNLLKHQLHQAFIQDDTPALKEVNKKMKQHIVDFEDYLRSKSKK